MQPAKKRGSALESSSSTDGPASGASRGAAPDGAVLVARLGKPNGLDGFIGLYAEPNDLVYFEPGSVVYAAGGQYEVRAIRQGKKGPQVAFAGVVDREGAELIRGSDVFVTQRRQLREREFWPDDLVGLEVRPGGGAIVGVVHGPAQDRIVVERDGVIFEVPFVDDLVPVVDLDEGFVEVIEIEGLSSLSDPQ